jgi:hypothetical protein
VYGLLNSKYYGVSNDYGMYCFHMLHFVFKVDVGNLVKSLRAKTSPSVLKSTFT